jgi:hypothetical protein
MTVMYIIDVPLDALILENGRGQAVDASYFVKDAKCFVDIRIYQDGWRAWMLTTVHLMFSCSNLRFLIKFN